MSMQCKSNLITTQQLITGELESISHIMCEDVYQTRKDARLIGHRGWQDIRVFPNQKQNTEFKNNNLLNISAGIISV